MQQIESYISTYIKNRGYKCSVLAAKAGLTPNALCRIMQGRRKIKADEFIALCNVLEINPTIFIN